MPQTLAHVTLVVRDYDEAIEYFVGSLGFELVEDTPLGAAKRWVLVRPRESRGAGLLLARAATPEQVVRIGDQTGGRVAFFLHTDDFWRDYRAMKERAIDFIEEPREEPYGTVVVFRDVYGNKWDLVGARHSGGSPA